MATCRRNIIHNLLQYICSSNFQHWDLCEWLPQATCMIYMNLYDLLISIVIVWSFITALIQGASNLSISLPFGSPWITLHELKPANAPIKTHVLMLFVHAGPCSITFPIQDEVQSQVVDSARPEQTKSKETHFTGTWQWQRIRFIDFLQYRKEKNEQ